MSNTGGGAGFPMQGGGNAGSIVGNSSGTSGGTGAGTTAVDPVLSISFHDGTGKPLIPAVTVRIPRGLKLATAQRVVTELVFNGLNEQLAEALKAMGFK